MCPNRTGRADRARQRGKSDALDAERIARETLAHSLLPKAFKRAGEDAGPDPQRELLMLWHRQRRSILTGRQHLLNEADTLLAELPLPLREQLPDSKAVRPRLRALARWRRRPSDPAVALRLRLLGHYHQQITRLDLDERAITRELAALVHASPSTLDSLCGLCTRSVAELLVEIGDPRRFTTPGFARFNASAPIPASTAEPANPSDTATTPAATAASTPSCTAWPSPNCAANRAPRRSTPTPANAATPRPKPAASSNATSPTSSTATCSATSHPQPLLTETTRAGRAQSNCSAPPDQRPSRHPDRAPRSKQEGP